MSSLRALPVILWSAGVAFAQYVVGARAGTIDVAIGQIYVDNQLVTTVGTNFLEMKEGQVLHTGNGRAELLLGPGVFLWLGPEGSVRLIDAGIREPAIELLSGPMIVELVDAAKGSRVRVQCGSAHTLLKAMGVYRFESNPGQVRVIGGQVEVSAGEKQVSAGKGRAVELDSMLTVSKFETKDPDDLHKWAAARSFDIFLSNADAISVGRRFFKQQTNWELTYGGWLWNRDFGMRFYSEAVAREVADQQAEDRQERRNTENRQEPRKPEKKK